METSGVEDVASRLLGAFYDLSGGRLTVPVVLDAAGDSGESAAARAGLNPRSTECAVAVRYLRNQGYLRARDSGYTITVAGMDRVRWERGLESPPSERKHMSESTQRRLVTLLSIGIAMGLSQPITNFIREEIPERRGISDDLLEAFLEGVVRMTSFFLASVIVRKLAGLR